MRTPGDGRPTAGAGDAPGTPVPADQSTSRSVGPSRVPRAAALALVLLMGGAWHFVYEWSGRLWVVGLVAPVNESVWEHAKLVALPVLVIGLALALRNRRCLGRILLAAVAGATVGTAVMLAGFYAYSAVTGGDVFVLDMLLFLVSAWAGVATLAGLADRGPDVPAWLGAAGVALMLLGFAILTTAPPDLSPFRVGG